MRYARRKDASHESVVAAFRAAGASVQAIESGVAGVPDLVVGIFGLDQLVEVKPVTGITRQRELRDSQVAWHRQWRGRPVAVVRSPEDALAVVAAMRGALTRSEVAS